MICSENLSSQYVGGLRHIWVATVPPCLLVLLCAYLALALPWRKSFWSELYSEPVVREQWLFLEGLWTMITQWFNKQSKISPRSDSIKCVLTSQISAPNQEKFLDWLKWRKISATNYLRICAVIVIGSSRARNVGCCFKNMVADDRHLIKLAPGDYNIRKIGILVLRSLLWSTLKLVLPSMKLIPDVLGLET